ncbi:MAG: DciA family protein [Alphaproteobacteria bacterium]
MTFKKKSFVAQGLKPVGVTVSTLLEPVWAQQNALEVRLMQAWPDILGKPWGEESFPEKLTFARQGDASQAQEGVLFLSVANGRALAFQYQLPFLLSRINGYFGYQAVTRIVLKQTSTLGGRQSNPSRGALALSQKSGVPLQAGLSEAIQQVQASQLQEALRGLGEALPGSSDQEIE